MTAKKRFSFLELGNKKKRKKSPNPDKKPEKKKQELKVVRDKHEQLEIEQPKKKSKINVEDNKERTKREKAKLWLQQRKEMKKLRQMNKESSDPSSKIIMGFLMIGGAAFLVWGYWKYEISRDYSGDGFTHFIYIIASIVVSFYWYSRRRW